MKILKCFILLSIILFDYNYPFCQYLSPPSYVDSYFETQDKFEIYDKIQNDKILIILEATLTVSLNDGIHIRPTRKLAFISELIRFETGINKIEIKKKGFYFRTAFSAIDLQSLGAKQGDEVSILICGDKNKHSKNLIYSVFQIYKYMISKRTELYQSIDDVLKDINDNCFPCIIGMETFFKFNLNNLTKRSS